MPSSTGHMEEQNSLQFSLLPIDWMENNTSGLLGDTDANAHHIMNPQSKGILLEPLRVPQWMQCQTMPSNYVEFLAEKGCPEIEKKISYNVSSQVPTLAQANPSKLEEYLKPLNEGDITTEVTGLEHQIGIQKQVWYEDSSHSFDTYSGSSSAASKNPSEAPKKSTKEKVCAAARSRRLKISYWLDALQELVPHAGVANRAALLDHVMDYINYLQNQMKDLCQSRLGGEPYSDSVISLEGDGHYMVQEQMLNGPLEEMMGRLIDVHPSAATEMLQRKGLVVMPMTFAEGLLEEMWDVQGKGAFLVSK